jgi:hypothetical protein
MEMGQKYLKEKGQKRRTKRIIRANSSRTKITSIRIIKIQKIDNKKMKISKKQISKQPTCKRQQINYYQLQITFKSLNKPSSTALQPANITIDSLATLTQTTHAAPSHNEYKSTSNPTYKVKKKSCLIQATSIPIYPHKNIAKSHKKSSIK